MNSTELIKEVKKLKKENKIKEFIDLTGVHPNAEIDADTLVKVICKITEKLKET